MTHDSVTNFAASLVEMARSHERVPLLEQHVAQLEAALSERAEQVQRLELRIIDMKADQDALYSKLRSVEVERDDASFRLLEAEDREAVIRHLLASAQGTLKDALFAVEPKASVTVPLTEGSPTSVPSESASTLISPASTEVEARPTESGEHEAQPLQAKPEGQGQSVMDPTVNSPSGNELQTAAFHDVEKKADALPMTTAEGQSAPHPTVQSGIAASPAPIQSVSPSSDADIQPVPSSSLIGDDEHIDWPAQFNRQFS